MSRVSPLRLCTTAGLALGTAAVGIALAPAALASSELPALEGSDKAVVGQPFSVTGTGCDAPEGESATVYVDYYTAASWDDEDGAPVLELNGELEDGAWTALTTFTPAAAPGEYVAVATCEPYVGAGLRDYPVFVFTLEAAPATSAPSSPSSAPSSAPVSASVSTTVAPTGEIRGTSSNTPGVASPDGGTATGDRSAPGQKVVKILTGFRPGEVVTVTLHSTPQRVASATADASGTVRIEFTVPAGTPTGDHTLVYEGSMGTYFQEAFAVTAAAGSGASLAYTGASVALPLGLGAATLALGGGLVFAARRRSAGAPQA